MIPTHENLAIIVQILQYSNNYPLCQCDPPCIPLFLGQIINDFPDFYAFPQVNFELIDIIIE